MTWYKKGSPQFNTSVWHKRATPFQPLKSVSSTQKTSVLHKNRQFNGKKRQNSFVSNWGFFVLNWWLCWTDAFYVFNWRVRRNDVFCVELTVFVFNGRFLCVKLTGVELAGVLNWRFLCWTDGFLCWTEIFSVLKRRIWRVELTDFGGRKEVVLVLNWCVELRGSVLNWGVLLIESSAFFVAFIINTLTLIFKLYSENDFYLISIVNSPSSEQFPACFCLGGWCVLLDRSKFLRRIGSKFQSFLVNFSRAETF